MPHIRRALISVSDKRGLIAFAQGLHALNVEIISTGGTYATLKEHRINAISISEYTGFPEILDGRVKTLHPKIHAGLLAIADDARHQQQLHELHIEAIDLVVVNLYPFEQTIARNGIPLVEAIEQIDIGGPAMIRAAAKNYRHKAVVVSPEHYDSILDEMKQHDGAISEKTCLSLARKVFRHTAAYDSVISRYLDNLESQNTFPDLFQLSLKKEIDLRYGENPHQRATLYGNFTSLFQLLHGKELSYNNIVDASAAAMQVSEFDEPAVAIIKHTNPCGVGSGAELATAYDKALATDPTSAYGGIVAVNRSMDMATAQRVDSIFTEILLAPEFPDDVLLFLKRKKDRRLIKIATDLRALKEPELRSVPGGLLVQDRDARPILRNEFRVVTSRTPDENEWKAMLFALRVARHVKSNAIVYAGPDRTIGVGAGQMSRVDSARIAAMKARAAGLELRGTAVASDAFFPFADGLLEVIQAGSTAVIQPGGSKRDEEVIAAANAHNIAMVFTNTRHFKH